MKFDTTMLVAVLAGAAIAGTHASCANSCSGHGTCGTHDRCTCYPMYEGTDCSLKSCPSGPAFVDGANAGDVHAYAVCSGRGTCAQDTGECACNEGFTGYNCGRSVCPNECSGHGKCAFANDISTAAYGDYDGSMTRSCICDGYYTGADCSSRQCPRGDDPLTTEIECQGVASGVQAHEIQEITVTANNMLAGEMTLTYTDAYGQAWTTSPIAVGGDNKFDIRLASGDTGSCSLRYSDAIDSARQSGYDGSTYTDFSSTDHHYPSNAAVSLSGTACNGATAAQMDTILSENPVASNVHVTKSTDITDGAKYEVTVGNLNFQNENTASEIGQFSLDGVSGEAVHPLGDHSEDIARALTSLPYGVIPSVTVSKVTVKSSDYASDDVSFGNGVQQKYRVTFSDAANAGDQNLLQCNAAGCNEDGCAPRYEGVNHEKFISTKYHAAQAEGQVTDYRTSIVATGQGGFWLRPWKANKDVADDFTSGTYYIHRDLGNGKSSSATFQFNDDQAAIESALQTIEGWSGIAVSCNSAADSYAKGKGTPGTVGHSATKHQFECYVTYPVGYDDGARLPTMTYDNFNGLTTAAAGGSLDFKCVNEICVIEVASGVKHGTILLSTNNAGDEPHFENGNGMVYIEAASPHTQLCTIPQTAVVVGETVTHAGSGAVGTVGKAGGTVTSLLITVTNGIDFPLTGGSLKINGATVVATSCNAANHAKFTTGTYEIIRTASSTDANFVVVFSPGQADCADYDACVNPLDMSDTLAQVYESTPLMPMWPDISNSIALHDTTFRVVLDAQAGTAEPLTSTLLTEQIWNIAYGNLGYIQTTLVNSGETTCADIQAQLIKFKDGGVSGFSTTNTPYPSLVDPADATRSICDCQKKDNRGIVPYTITFDITCPAFIANHMYISRKDQAVRGAAGSSRAVKIATGGEFMNAIYYYVRDTPPSGITTKVAVGDTLTVLASGANNNKQFTVKSFVTDGNFGSGQNQLWSTNAAFLGMANINNLAAALDTTTNYRAYGDFVQYAKVDPAPTSDYHVLEMKATGQNGTSFTRTLESVSTTTNSIATLTFYDNAAGQSFANSLSGTFQLMYGDEETAVMQASVTAKGMQEALAGVSTIGAAPTVTKANSGGTIGSHSVTWTISFDPKDGDAKKLTFKYTDAINSERKTSAVLGSGGAALVNTISAAAGSGVWGAGAKNQIVMQYTQEGSTFYDAVSTTAADIHDELAADTTVGTTLDVQAAEDIYWYLYQESGAALSDVDAAVCAGWVAATGTTLSTAPSLIFEFNGEFTAPVPMCSSTSAFTVFGTYATAIQGLTGLETASVYIAGLGAGVASTASDTLFQKHFPWSATHFGTAVAHMAITLPLGVDGSSFRVHAQIDTKIGWRLTTAGEGTAYTYRARNNNGRKFTVTQAYENKIGGAVHFSRGVAEVAASPKGSASGVVTGVSVGSSVTAAGLNPGTYYNVKLYHATGIAWAAVTVSSSGIAKVEITAGGILVTKGLAFTIQCDTRISSGLDDTSANNAACAPTHAANNAITVTTGDATTAALTNTLQASLIVGSVPTAIADGANNLCGTSQNGAGVGLSFATLNFDNPSGGTPATHKIAGVKANVGCASGAADATFAQSIIVAGGSTDADGTLPADISALQLTALKIETAQDVNTLTFGKGHLNAFYYQAGFYDTTTPKFFRDGLHEGLQQGGNSLDHQKMTIMGGRTGTGAYYHALAATCGVDDRQMFGDLNHGVNGEGYGRMAAANRQTSSVVAGSQGDGASVTPALANLFMEWMPKYSYVGRGVDQLTVTPAPDEVLATDTGAAGSTKMIVTYTGATGSCSVTEVDRGTHESSVCSGRGNCDTATGTCLCDAGYTLEACSEQTVLV